MGIEPEILFSRFLPAGWTEHAFWDENPAMLGSSCCEVQLPRDRSSELTTLLLPLHFLMVSRSFKDQGVDTRSSTPSVLRIVSFGVIRS